MPIYGAQATIFSRQAHKQGTGLFTTLTPSLNTPMDEGHTTSGPSVLSIMQKYKGVRNDPLPGRYTHTHTLREVRSSAQR